ncbi:Ig-like domain-containing protein (plasmid) [Shewanella sp. HL-SH4]|uniref:Ig-like domain-containing protein n=1 Tax=Shewanella sp. HL-SH4 TaxID=3436240 RepID=UPI003EBC9BE2
MNIRSAFFCLLLMVLSGGVLASANTLLPDVKALALDKLVLDRTDQPVTVIETSPIMTSKGEVAKGMTEIILSLDASAKNSLIIQGKTLAPGSTLSIVQDLTTTNGAIKIPAYPEKSDINSSDRYIIDVPKVTAQLCSDEYKYDQAKNVCLKVNTTNLTYTCPDLSWQPTGDLSNCIQQSTIAKESCPEGLTSNGNGTCSKAEYLPTVAKCQSGFSYSAINKRCEKTSSEPASFSCPTGYYRSGSVCYLSSGSTGYPECPSGYRDVGGSCYRVVNQVPDPYYVCPSGFTKDKWNTGKCTDSQAYISNQGKQQCLDAGGLRYYYDGVNQICIFVQPHQVSAPYICPSPGQLMAPNSCVNPNDTRSPSYYCPYGETYADGACRNSTSLEAYCKPGYAPNGNDCSFSVTENPEWVCDDNSFSKISETQCSRLSNTNLIGTCPANYVRTGNICTMTSIANQMESCSETFVRNGAQCERDVFKAAICEGGLLSENSCTCPSDTTLNVSSWMCEGKETSPILKACPLNYVLDNGECKFSHQVGVVYDYCGSGMISNGANCSLDVSIPATQSCNAPYSVSQGQCKYTQELPAGVGGGAVEAKSFEGKFVTESSAITLATKNFDALVLEINELAIDVDGGCRLVATDMQAKGVISKGNILCSVSWMNLPRGITGKDNKLTGIFAEAGEQVVGYQLKTFSGLANNPIIVSEGEININVAMPTMPTVNDITTRLMNQVVRGFEVSNYDANSKINLTSVLVEERSYEQLIEIEGVGSCTVASKGKSCNIYSDVAFSLDVNNLEFSSTYKVWANSKVGGWDKGELTSKSWVINHDFRGPQVQFSTFNGDRAGESVTNNELGFPVIVNGGSGSVGIKNFRDNLPATERWWRPNKVEFEFSSVDGKESVSVINVDDMDVLFDVPQSIEGTVKLSSNKVEERENSAAYSFNMSSLTPGSYNVKITASDAFNNTTITTVEDVKVPTPAPQIKVFNKKVLVGGSSTPSVLMLDDLMIVAHNGLVGDSQITSVKIDGRDATSSNEEGHFRLLTGNGFDLSANKRYELEVEAKDSTGATTKVTIPLNYLLMEFNFQRKPQTVIQLVEDVGLIVSRTKGVRCDIYGTKAAAALAANERNHTCYVEWSKIPDGMTTESSSYQSVAKGGVSNLGQNTAAYIAYVVNKSGVTSVVSQGEVTFEALPPAPITIKLDERLKLGQDVYSISVLDRQIGRYQGTSSRANVDIDLTTNAGDMKQYKHNQLPFGEIQNFSAYADKLGGAKLWDKVPYTLKGAYRLAPELSTTVNFELVVTPHPYMQVLMDLDDTRYASTEKINATISLGIKNNLTNTFDYSIETMGTGWDVYLAFKKGKDYEPISDAIQIGTNGKGVIQIDADTIFNRNEAVYAVAEARSPYPEVEITRVSIPRSITVVKGTAVDGEIVSRVVHSRIPAAFDLRFDTESFQDFMVMGEIKWQRDVSGSWVDMTELTGRQYVSVKSVEPETIDVRAVITNKETGAVTETETLRLISFDKPKMRIDGVTQAISGQTLELTAVDVSGGVLSDAVYEWSMDGETWEKGFATYNVNVENSSVRVYGRMKYANTSDEIQMDQWATAVKYISVTKPKPITLNVVRPSMAEVDSEIALKMLVSNPFASTGVDLFTEWLLPDGTVIKDQKEITYTLQESDLDSSKRVTLVARSWLDGFKDVTLGQANAVMNTFSYSFPSESDLSLTVNNNVKFVPSSGYATVNMPYINAPGVVFTYDWTFDDTVIKKVSSNGKGMNFNVIQAGVHEIMATVSDNRGNFAHIKNYVEAQKPNDLSFVLNEVYSNKFMRAPLTASIYPNVKVGHPYDFVKEYTWTVNGVKSEPSSRAVGAFNELVEGHYDIILDVKTNFGQVGQTTFSVDVVANKLPTCAPSVRSQYGTYIVDANCKDEDGRITFYKWVVNGMVFSPYGPQVRFTEHDYPNGATITIEANDDAGGKGVGHTSF